MAKLEASFKELIEKNHLRVIQGIQIHDQPQMFQAMSNHSSDDHLVKKPMISGWVTWNVQHGAVLTFHLLNSFEMISKCAKNIFICREIY